MRENVFYELIACAKKIAKYYKVLSKVEKNKRDIKKTKTYEKLILILDLEERIYNTIHLDDLADYVECVNELCPGISINFLYVLNGEYYFNPLYRIYTKLFDCISRNSIFNELHDYPFDQEVSKEYLVDETIGNAIKTLFLKGYKIKDNYSLIDIKYNLIYSVPKYEESIFKLNTINIEKNLKNLLKFINFKPNEFLNFSDTFITNLFIMFIADLTTKEKEYFNSLEFINSKEVYIFTLRLLFFLIHDTNTINFLLKKLDFESKENEYLKDFLEEMYIGMNFDGVLKKHL